MTFAKHYASYGPAALWPPHEQPRIVLNATALTALDKKPILAIEVSVEDSD